MDLKDNNEIKKEENSTKKFFKFFVKMALVFLAFQIFGAFGGFFITEGIYNALVFGKYNYDIIAEIVVTILIIGVIFLSKNQYIFKEKGMSFIKSLRYGLPLLVISLVFLITSVLEIKDQTIDIYNFLSIILYCIFIGLFEEFLCRGWIQNEFMERFGRTYKGVLISIIISSLFFGLMHFSNIGSQSTFETIVQVIYTFGSGIFLGAVYYRTRNIWTVVFLHAFYDFSLMVGTVNTWVECSMVSLIPSIDTILSNTIPILFIALCLILTSVIILNKKDVNYRIANSKISDKQIKKIKFPAIIAIVVLIICAIVTMIFIPYDEKDYYCPEYDIKKMDKTERHIFDYDEFEITHKDELTGENYNFKFEIVMDKIGNGDYALITNLSTNQSEKLDLDDIYSLKVFENDGVYEILIEDYSINSTIYHSDFMSKDNLSNDKSYLKDLISSFNKYTFPEVVNIGYIKDMKTNKVYPYILDDYYNEFIIDEDDKAYILKSE